MARLALTDAYIMTATRGVLDKGTIVIKDTRIEAIGTNIRVPRRRKSGASETRWSFPA